MQILAIDGFIARCAARGVEREANLLLLQYESPKVGDFVMVHLGYARSLISPQDAADAWAVYDELLAADAASRAP
jgi:hydrogenase expression/formation protein HypC